MRVKRFTLVLILAAVAAGLILSSHWWNGAGPVSASTHSERIDASSVVEAPKGGGIPDIPVPSSKSQVSEITPKEKEQIERRFAEAETVLHQIELGKAKPLNVTDGRTASVHVPSLTIEDLQPMYNALSRAAEGFHEGGAARLAFRRKADSLVAQIRNRPGKVFMRSFDNAGNATYKLATLSERTTVTATETGGVRIEGYSNIRLVKPQEVEKAAQFFDKFPVPAAPGERDAER